MTAPIACSAGAFRRQPAFRRLCSIIGNRCCASFPDSRAGLWSQKPRRCGFTRVLRRPIETATTRVRIRFSGNYSFSSRPNLRIVWRGGIILCRPMLDSRLLVGIVSPNSVKSSLLTPVWATGLRMGAPPGAGVGATQIRIIRMGTRPTVTLFTRQGTRTTVSCRRRACLSQSHASQ